MRWLLIYGCCAWLAKSAVAASTNDIPPMIIARNPQRVYETATGYTVQYGDGKSEQWYRSGTGFSTSTQHFYRTLGGFSGEKDERYYKTAAGWSGRAGGQQIMIYSNVAGFSMGSNHFYRTQSGLTRP